MHVKQIQKKKQRQKTIELILDVFVEIENVRKEEDFFLAPPPFVFAPETVDFQHHDDNLCVENHIRTSRFSRSACFHHIEKNHRGF